MFKMIVTTANYDVFEDDFVEGMSDTALADVEQRLQNDALNNSFVNAEDIVTVLCNDQFEWLAHYLRFKNKHTHEDDEYKRQALLARYAYLTMLPYEQEHKIELPIAYVNLIDAELKYAKEHGLYEDTPDAEFVQGCIEDIEESLIKPLQELDKDGIIIIKE